MTTQRSNDGLLRIVVIVLGVIVLFPLLMMVFAMSMMGMMGWWWGDGMAGGLSPLWGMGMMLVWLGVLLGIGYLFYKGLIGGVRTRAVSDPAFEELRLAYARGDITNEEFAERRAQLQRTDD